MSMYVDGAVKLTYEEYRLFPDDGRRHEVIDGEHHASPSPNTNHQKVSRHLQFALYRQIELAGLGQVFNAPMDVELTPTDIVQPDIIVVRSDNYGIVLPSRLRGVPDLVIEILSPSTRDIDTTLKRALYEAVGVPEYWIVDPEERSLMRLVMFDGRYGAPTTHRDAISFMSATVDLAEVWRRL